MKTFVIDCVVKPLVSTLVSVATLAAIGRWRQRKAKKVEGDV